MKRIILMRHSISIKDEKIHNECLPLSNEGRKLALKIKDKFAKESIQKVYSSNYLRAIQTAEIFGKPFSINKNLHERTIGFETPNFWRKQYQDHDFKNKEGESLNEVKTRMKIAILEILNEISEGQTALIISHATAIFSYLMNYCSIEVTDIDNKVRKVMYNNQEIFNNKFNQTDFFILEFTDENNLKNIKRGK